LKDPRWNPAFEGWTLVHKIALHGRPGREFGVYVQRRDVGPDERDFYLQPRRQFGLATIDGGVEI